MSSSNASDASSASFSGFNIRSARRHPSPTLKLLLNFISLFLSFSIPYYCQYAPLQYKWQTLQLVFYASLFSFVVSWCSGLHTFIRTAAVASFAYQSWKSISVQDPSSLVTGGVFLGVAFYLLAINKKSINVINDFKTVLFDWFVMILLFPAGAVSDLYLKTNLFFPLVGYFVGNLIAYVVAKAAQRVWTYFLDYDDYENQDLFFINLLRISRPAQERLHLRELLICVWVSAFFFYQAYVAHISAHGSSANERVEMMFAVGVFSTLTCYLGPVSARAFLSDQELVHVLDHNVLVYLGKAVPKATPSQHSHSHQH